MLIKGPSTKINEAPGHGVRQVPTSGAAEGREGSDPFDKNQRDCDVARAAGDSGPHAGFFDFLQSGGREQAAGVQPFLGAFVPVGRGAEPVAHAHSVGAAFEQVHFGGDLRAREGLII